MKVKIDPHSCMRCKTCDPMCPELYKMYGDILMERVNSASPAPGYELNRGAESASIDAMIA